MLRGLIAVVEPGINDP